ncbi:MAG: type II secretion system F family protein [Anaerolineales bacterium]|nr:type II secretion system F family protein [Anaerolineales bacterium]
MSATAAAGISRARVFELAKEVDSPSAQYFEEVSTVAENLRLNYPDACRLVGDRTEDSNIRAFLYRLSDALRAGEPLPIFLEREAHIQGENYENDYSNELESMKKWNDGYISVTISAALVVIINMVSTIIYPIGMAVMAGMAFVAIAATFLLAWVISRAAPQEIKWIELSKGSAEQNLARKLVMIMGPFSLVLALILFVLKVDVGWIFIAISICIFPAGIAFSRADNHTYKKDREISAFLRSLGGTATSRGTTLGEGLNHMMIDSFPALEMDIKRLGQRLKAFVKPSVCWEMFAFESGSQTIKNTVGIFYRAITLGGDPEKSGNLSSIFAMKTALLRAKRQGAAATFSWLVIIMHMVSVALLNFMLSVLDQFSVMINQVMTADMIESTKQVGMELLSYMAPQNALLDEMGLFLVIMLVLINAFAIVASEGSPLLKVSYYVPIMFLFSGVSYLIVPPTVSSLLGGI